MTINFNNETVFNAVVTARHGLDNFYNQSYGLMAILNDNISFNDTTPEDKEDLLNAFKALKTGEPIGLYPDLYYVKFVNFNGKINKRNYLNYNILDNEFFVNTINEMEGRCKTKFTLAELMGMWKPYNDYKETGLIELIKVEDD